MYLPRLTARALAASFLLLAACGAEPRNQAALETVRGGWDGERSSVRSGDEAEKESYVGVIVARNVVNLAAKRTGEIVEMRVRQGDLVSRGDVIALLDSSAAEQALAVARAEVGTAMAEHALTEVDVADKERELALATELVSGGTGATKLREDARFALERARAGLDRAKARVAEAEARVKQWERELAETRIVAPFDGRVSACYRDVGALVGPDVPVVRLISGGALTVRFAVGADVGPEVEVGEAAIVEVSDLDVEIAATVSEVAPEVEPASRMIFAEAVLDVPEPLRARILSGMDARVRLAGTAR